MAITAIRTSETTNTVFPAFDFFIRGSPFYTLNTVCSLISAARDSTANFVLWYLNFHCSSFVVAGSPSGYGIEIVGTILLEPTVFATGIRLHICTIGNPAFSTSFTIVAPQRVQVPHVETIITPSTPSSFRYGMISFAILSASACVVPVPTVV